MFIATSCREPTHRQHRHFRFTNDVVIGGLDVAREQIVPSLGATSYGISAEQIEILPQGENTPFNQVLLRAPGTAQDSLEWNPALPKQGS